MREQRGGMGDPLPNRPSTWWASLGVPCNPVSPDGSAASGSSAARSRSSSAAVTRRPRLNILQPFHLVFDRRVHVALCQVWVVLDDLAAGEHGEHAFVKSPAGQPGRPPCLQGVVASVVEQQRE